MAADSSDAELETLITNDNVDGFMDEEAAQASPVELQGMSWRRSVNRECTTTAPPAAFLRSSNQAWRCNPLPVPPALCNAQTPTCCVTERNPDCATLLRTFYGGGTTSQSLLMSTLIADLTVVQEMIANGQPRAAINAKECELKQKWAGYGADISSIKITAFRPPAGETADITMGAMFTAGPSTYVIISWTVGYNFNTADDVTVPYEGNRNMLVKGEMYNYYKYIESTGFFQEVRLLSKNTDVVFAGLSAGAAASQFAALDFKRVRGVYMYGLQKIGNAAFQRHYAAKRGAVTTSWWNRFDAWQVVPPQDAAQQALLPQNVPDTIIPDMRMLDMRFWWRVNPYTSACERMTAELAEPCARTGVTTCPLNTVDHEPEEHFNRIRACVTINSQCLNDLEILDP